MCVIWPVKDSLFRPDLAEGGRTADKDCSIWLIKAREKLFF